MIKYPTTHATRRCSRRARFRRRRACALLVAAGLSACAGSSDATTTASNSDPVASEAPPVATEAVSEVTEPAPTDVVTSADDEPGITAAEPETDSGDGVVETRDEVGPRVLDIDAAVMLVVDAIDVSGDDVFVRVKVVNGSGEFLNVEAEGDLYGPLIELRDDREHVYPARAVEPAGVDVYSVGRMRFRLDGPFDPNAESFTVGIGTSRGRLTTDPIAVPEGGAVRWWKEAPPIVMSDLVGVEQDGRTVQVLDVVDRGTHLDVSIAVSAASAGFMIPDDLTATLTLDDGTELTSLPLDSSAAGQVNEFSGVLRFLGSLPTGAASMSLNMAGIDVEIPLGCTVPTCWAQLPPEASDALLAAPARLPDLLHFDVDPEPLPTSTIET